MKILIDGRLYGLENAGLGRYVINLVFQLQKIDKKNSYFLLLRRKYFSSLKLADNWQKVLADFRHYSFKEQFLLPLIIKKLKPDLVHFPHFNVPIFYHGMYVVTIHDMLMHKSKGKAATILPLYKYYLKRLLYKAVFSCGVKNAKAIIVPSLSVKKDLIKAYKVNGEKITVTHEGVDKNITQYSKSTDKLLVKYKLPKNYLIYVGNAYPHKNLEIVIRAIKELNKEKDKKLVFVIVSARDVFIRRLKKTINYLKAEKYTRLLGFVPDKELGSLLKASCAFIFPSFSEGFGLPGLEALASRTLLLASNIPVFKEIYQDNAYFFDPKDVSSIKLSINKVLDMNVSERKQKIIRAKKFIKRYSWFKMAKQTLKIYESSLGI